jgi:hypothetical protein
LAAQFQQALELSSLPVRWYHGREKLQTHHVLAYAKINAHIVANNVLALAQNRYRVGSHGTKEFLLIDMTIC